MANRGRHKIGAVETSNGSLSNRTENHSNGNNNRRVSQVSFSANSNHGYERSDSKAVLIQVQSHETEESDLITDTKSTPVPERKSNVLARNGNIQNGGNAMVTQNVTSDGRTSSKTSLLDKDSGGDPSKMDTKRSKNHLAVDPPSETAGSRRPSIAESFVSSFSSQTQSRRKSGINLWTNVRNVIRVGSEIKSTARKKRKKKVSTQRVDSFLQKFTIREGENTGDPVEEDFRESDDDSSDDEDDDWTFVVNPEGDVKFYWLTLLCVAIIYNFWTIILRQAWPDIHTNCKPLWFTLDYICDFLYLVDIFMQMRGGYLEQGLLVLDDKKLAMKYIKSRYFAIDLISLTPLDFLYLVTTRTHTLMRFPRLFKCYRYVQWSKLAQSRSAHPNVLRVGNLCNVILLLMHWFSCIYFIICEIIGLGSDSWVYPEPEGVHASIFRQYLASFYWSILTLTMLGDVPEPETEPEYIFQIISYLGGLFIFATIVGQIGTVIENRNAMRLQFERHVDNAKKYMRAHAVPKDVQERIQRWYDYTWDLDDADINALGLLPDKMRAELALHVNLKTLKKVTIFNECPPAFLHDLVLKMKTSVFTPGDLVCRKGEVAREMYIISDGVLEVVGTNGTIVTTLKNGDYFGEIGILNIDGVANRRTADVRSVGYSNLFTLCKDDVLLAIQDYPQAEKVLALEARRRIKDQNEAVKRKQSAMTKQTTSDLDSLMSDASAETTLSGDEITEMNEPMSENNASDGRKHSIQLSSSHDQKSMASIVGMVRPKLQRKSSSRLSMLKPVIEQRLPRGSKRRGRNSISTSDEDDFAADIASCIGSAIREKMDEYKVENKRLRKHKVDLETRIDTLQEENNEKEEKISLLWKRIVELEEDVRSTRRKESTTEPEVHIEGHDTTETQA